MFMHLRRITRAAFCHSLFRNLNPVAICRVISLQKVDKLARGRPSFMKRGRLYLPAYSHLDLGDSTSKIG